MSRMFQYSKFNQPIGDWDVSHMKKMHNMFSESDFNQDISKWKIKNGCETDDMLSGCRMKEEYKPKSLQK